MAHLPSILSLFLLVGLVNSTIFIFGITLKCDLDKPFTFSIEHWEDDGGSGDDLVTNRYTSTAYKSIFFYQKSPKHEGDGPWDNYFELYTVVAHNCTKDGSRTHVKKFLYPHTLTDHGIEMIDYEVDLSPYIGEDISLI